MLATAAAVIASQATISGAFSMARQAVQLDLLPRLRVLQTSAQEQGQIYVPIVNWLVFPAVVLFVVGFGSSDALGGAYGAAVVGTMLMTTILGAFVAATQWNWPKWQVGGAVRPDAGHRLCLRRRQPHQGPPRRLDPAHPRGGAVPDLHDLAQRAPGAARARWRSWRCRAASSASSWRACTASPAPGCSWRATRTWCPRP